MLSYQRDEFNDCVQPIVTSTYDYEIYETYKNANSNFLVPLRIYQQHTFTGLFYFLVLHFARE